MEGKKSIPLAIAAVIATVLSVWLAHRPAVSRQATWEDVIAEAKAGGYRIIKTEELADRYHKDPSKLLLVDTRQEWEYRTGHMEGAVNFPMEPTRWARFQKAGALGKMLGPDKERGIVFY